MKYRELSCCLLYFILNLHCPFPHKWIFSSAPQLVRRSPSCLLISDQLVEISGRSSTSLLKNLRSMLSCSFWQRSSTGSWVCSYQDTRPQLCAKWWDPQSHLLSETAVKSWLQVWYITQKRSISRSVKVTLPVTCCNSVPWKAANSPQRSSQRSTDNQKRAISWPEEAESW